MSDVIPVRVALRIRPLSSKEIENGCDTALDKVPGRPQVTLRNSEKAFTFDYAFGTDTAQSDIYIQSVQPLIEKLFKGFNATVLAYGQTGSGKTFSMGTSNRENETPIHLEGAIPRAVRQIFEKMQGLEETYDFLIKVSLVELYKEKLYDLLSTSSKMKEDCMVDLREDPVKGVVVNNLTEVVVNSLKETMEQLERGSVKRVTAATAMNNVSSRSHAIFTVYLEGTKKSSDTTESSKDTPENIVAKFHLVDLAGSERAQKTQATGVRFKEGTAINLGLLALGNVISALGDENGPKSHIPYRDSKLTRLLQDSLGGNSHTLMIACVSPSDSNVEETISTLRYADRARKIKNKPIVNTDGKDAENAKLRREIAELRLLLINGGGGSGGAPISSKEVEELKLKNSKLSSDNRDLTSALMSCQDELSHMNEKLLLTEDANVKFKTKLEQLASEAESICKDLPGSEAARMKLKIQEILDTQKENEKTLANHEASRFDESNTSSTTFHSANDGDDHEEMGATEALKQNALATQLAALNKQLAAKEQYALVLNQQEQELKEVREKYEVQMNQLESQLKNLEAEKDHLTQKNRAEPATSKLSEQRRKRIQELEQEMQELKKKVMEQQRMIKLNEKNEQKVKKLAEEIHGMKQAKVRLIKQMKEEAERVRTWKIQKEKEVNQLKQKDRKQQVQMTKMETLHSKQQNVLRRKMEEAVAANKRLKDVLEKQKAAKKMNSAGTKHGLAGAAERMRNLVSQELDVVVSVKEAKKSREQLLKDRTTVTKQLADMKRKTRTTMTNTEREEMQKKMSEMEDELAMQNVQIGELQKQIMDSDQNDDSSGAGGLNNKWWDALSTMTEAKIALQFLFEKASESMANLSNTESNYNEIKALYDEAIKNTEALEDEISNLKEEHAEELIENGKEYEERVAFLLKQLTSKTITPEMKDSEVEKFSELHEKLRKMSQDLESNRRKKAAPKAAKTNLLTPGHYKAVFGDSESDSEGFDDSDDEDWQKTPLMKRIKSVQATYGGSKRRLGETFTEGSSTSNSTLMNGSKRSSGSGCCSCKTDCRKMNCGCKKRGAGCTDACKCALAICKNRREDDQDQDRSAMSDVTNNTTVGTMSLLSDSYQVPVMEQQAEASRKSPPRIKIEDLEASENRSPKKVCRGVSSFTPSLFKSPRKATSLAEDDTPPKVERTVTLFKSPIRK